MLTAHTIKDDEILDFSDAVRALVVRALGEDDEFPPNHPLVIEAKRKIAAMSNLLRAP